MTSLKISAITAYAVKAHRRYQMSGQIRPARRLPGSDYFQFPPYPELYSDNSEAMVVKVETDEGLIGWGEAQNPIGPEVSQKIVEKVLGPMVLGHDPLATNIRYLEMSETLRVRGQNTGYMHDAMGAIDTALWDIKGKALGLSVSELLGGRFRETLPCYVTGLRAGTRDERLEEAQRWIQQGVMIKLFLGFGLAEDTAEVSAVRRAVGDEARLFMDGVWKYNVPEALRVGRMLEAHGVEFFESPLLPEDIEGHARLARKLDVPIAIGEALRGRHQFLAWLQAQALGICQPDVMRNGISETAKIALLAETFNTPVALHCGVVTVIGMAATWHVAATLPNFFVQEYQPVMLELFNPWLIESLRLEKGELVVPTGPGLGIHIDEERLIQDVDSQVRIEL